MKQTRVFHRNINKTKVVICRMQMTRAILGTLLLISNLILPVRTEKYIRITGSLDKGKSRYVLRMNDNGIAWVNVANITAGNAKDTEVKLFDDRIKIGERYICAIPNDPVKTKPCISKNALTGSFKILFKEKYNNGTKVYKGIIESRDKRVLSIGEYNLDMDAYEPLLKIRSEINDDRYLMDINMYEDGIFSGTADGKKSLQNMM